MNPTMIKLNAEDVLTESTRAMIFGELVKLAAPVVQRFQSDLFHDAQWLQDNIIGACVFFYVPRGSGTHIGMDRELCEAAARMDARGAQLYRLTVGQDRLWWTLKIESVEP